MGEKIKLGEVEIDVALAEAELAHLEGAIGHAVDRTKGLGAALVAAQREFDAAGAVAKSFKDALRAAAGGADSQAASLKKAQKEADEYAKTVAKSRSLFNEAFGGGEIKEKLEKVGAAFKIAGDKSQDSTTRTVAWAAGARMAAGVAVQAAQAVIELGRQYQQFADEVDVTRRQLVMLGDEYRRVQERTGHTVSAAEAFAASEAMLSSGIREHAGDLATVTRAAQDYARIHGGSATDATNRLMQAIQSGDNGALALFGVRLNNARTAAERARQTLDQLTQAQQRAAPAAANYSQVSARLEQSLRAVGAQLIRGLDNGRSEAREVQDVTDRLTRQEQAILRVKEATQQEIRAQREAREADGARAAAQLTARRAFLEGTQQAINAVHAQKERVEQLRDALDRTSTSTNRFSYLQRMLAGDLTQSGTFVEQQTARVNAARMLAQERIRRRSQTREDLRLAGQGESAAMRRELRGVLGVQGGGAGGGMSAERSRELQEQLNVAIAQTINLGGILARVERVRGETAEHFAERRLRAQQSELAAQQALGERLRGQREAQVREAREAHGREVAAHREAFERQQAERRAAEEIYEETRARDAREREERRVSGDFGSQMREQFRHTTTAAQDMAGAIHGSLESAGGALSSHIQAWATGRETIGEAAFGIAQDVAASLAQMAIPKAFMAYADGFAALAGQNYAAAAQAFTAAGLYTAIAAGSVGAMAGLAAAKGGGAVSATPVSSRPARADRGAGDGGEGGNTTIVLNVNGALTNAGVEDGVVRILDSAAQRGVLPRFMRQQAQARP